MKKRLLPLAALAFAFVACEQNDDLVVDNTKDTLSPSFRLVWQI